MTSVIIAQDTIVKTPSPNHDTRFTPTYTHTLCGLTRKSKSEEAAARIEEATLISALPNLPTNGFARAAEFIIPKSMAKVEADFTDGKPLAARYDVCAAGALTAEEAKAIEVVVTLPGGETADDWSATVASGRLSLVNPHPGGFIFILR